MHLQSNLGRCLPFDVSLCHADLSHGHACRVASLLKLMSCPGIEAMSSSIMNHDFPGRSFDQGFNQFVQREKACMDTQMK